MYNLNAHKTSSLNNRLQAQEAMALAARLENRCTSKQGGLHNVAEIVLTMICGQAIKNRMVSSM